MNYRPITDTWFLARPKVNYYGAYPHGFLHGRARALIGPPFLSVLHVCGGAAKRYPGWADLCPLDKTLDLDARLAPDYLMNANDPLPDGPELVTGLWDGIIADPPYTLADAEHYAVHTDELPEATALLRNCLKSVRVGGRVGMLHYLLPRPAKDTARFLACVGVIVGFGNRKRCYSVFERLK